ncbi:MAG: UDP-2,3-diacylglucosamine diphosphatase [Gemmatimonadales bacterium]|nr:UDP-2,3-diacylglucosamine diphosphatase [Gemmatimonadales bacterium]
MPPQQLVIVQDAHLGAAPPEAEEALMAFLDAVPRLGDALLVNGDLFDFWFAYRRAIPRKGFLVAAELARLARKIPVMMTGGNHDRWGDSFWDRDAGVRFSSGSLRFDLGARQALAIHGDGIAEQHWGGRLIHRITRHPVSAFLFRSVPPDLGFRLVDRMSTRLADSTRDHAILDRAARNQEQWALDQLSRDPDLHLLVMGHTHRPALQQTATGATYLNPGAWLDGHRYAVATPDSCALRQWG